MYDYVVVGAGTAGCVLASRLSEDPDVQVCLVEAGPPDDDPMFHVPVAGGKFFRTRYDWDYDSHPERSCDGRRVYLPQARVLGGGSAVNGMAYVRGNRTDYDGWDLAGWRYADLLPYFKRSEDNERGADEYHGVGGPLRVSDGRSRNPSALSFVDAAREAGHPLNLDFNGATQEGFGAYQVTQRDGLRAGTASEFLRAAGPRSNLVVETGLEVHRVLVESGRAVGIVGDRAETLMEIRAEREVVLCAGAYNSPKLLMLSGIGPGDALRDVGVPILVDHPQVGRNLQDHPHVWLSFRHDRPISLLAAGEPRHALEYERDRRGMLTSNGPETGGFLRTGATPDAAPDLQFICIPLDIVDTFLSPPTRHAISFGASVLNPASRGRVTLFSDEPTAKPRIIHDYLAEPQDLDLAVAGLRLGLDLAARPALRPYTVEPSSVPESDSRADLQAFVRRRVQTGLHPSGTCAIGGVVDTELRVTGVAGLRVADASVIPTLVRGNTMAPVIAVAERGADLIREVAAPNRPQTPAPGRD